MSVKKKVLVCGAGGFIGSHVSKRLKREGHHVVGVDLKHPSFSETAADEFYLQDLTQFTETLELFRRDAFDEVFQFAADMGGAGYINTGEHDDEVVWNSMAINLNVVKSCVLTGVKRVFYASSACVYPEHDQLEAFNPGLKEELAYPADPDSEYGWEKLFSERLYATFARRNSLEVRIARFHNIFGEEGTWDGGKEKAPAAVCRKVALVGDGGVMAVWGDGKQTRSFLHITEAVEGIFRLMRSDHDQPLNIGSDQLISINDLYDLVAEFDGKQFTKEHDLSAPQGVRGRNSDNTLVESVLGWRPSKPLHEGLRMTYEWIKEQILERGNCESEETCVSQAD
jgi:nucleoside-diphosphate-sugar epimerase